MLPPGLMEQLERLHSGPGRGYHAWSHPLALLALLPEVRDELGDAVAVECAILFHDVVYDPTRTDNEKKSASVAAVMMRGLAPEDTVIRALQLIEATEFHRVPETMSTAEAQDCRIFLDLDLSILGAGEAEFDAYEAGVRHEYRHVPDQVFRKGRSAILERFLGRERLYLSDWGYRRFETKARENLARSLENLRGEPAA